VLGRLENGGFPKSINVLDSMCDSVWQRWRLSWEFLDLSYHVLNPLKTGSGRAEALGPHHPGSDVTEAVWPNLRSSEYGSVEVRHLCIQHAPAFPQFSLQSVTFLLCGGILSSEFVYRFRWSWRLRFSCRGGWNRAATWADRVRICRFIEIFWPSRSFALICEGKLVWGGVSDCVI